MISLCAKSSQWVRHAKSIEIWDESSIEHFIEGLEVDRDLAYWTDGSRPDAYWHHTTHSSAGVVRERISGSYSDIQYVLCS